jgi:hypothetical protein
VHLVQYTTHCSIARAWVAHRSWCALLIPGPAQVSALLLTMVPPAAADLVGVKCARVWGTVLVLWLPLVPLCLRRVLESTYTPSCLHNLGLGCLPGVHCEVVQGLCGTLVAHVWKYKGRLHGAVLP